MKDKVAYLFLVYGDINQPKVWERYFDGHDETTKICCHAVERDATVTPFLKNNLIPYWVSTKWGTLGLIVAQLELIRYALRDPDVQRLVLCSGSCVPIKTYEDTYASLFEHDKSWIRLYTQYLERMSKVTHIDKSSHRKHSQWVMLTRKHATMLVRFNYLCDFVRCVVPDEHYVGSVLVHLNEEKNILKREQTCAHWHKISPVEMSPMEHSAVSEENVKQWHDTTSLFARKFNVDSNISKYWNTIVGNKE